MKLSAPLIHKVDCVRLHLSSLEEGLAFYRDRLRHELIWRTGEAVGLRLPGCEVEIVLHTTPPPPEIDFTVPSADAAAVRFLEAGDAIIVPPFDIQNGRCADVQDPWNNQYILLDTSQGLLTTDAEGRVIGNARPE
ncbi:MAG TPA: VOC family protein [Aggregatilineaceae bacterium]|jgi:catechol 2,3-dioxygenase-like lactoylglutathione lyase family enzyme|nr:VOC family protein [Aggregatilineaceae bacterium]